MEEDSLWNYYQAGDEPANDGTGKNWKEVGYDDSSWESGQGQLGFNEGDEHPNGGLMVKGPIAFYFRQTIMVTQSQINLGNQLRVELLRDDGAIVYVNGVEIRRDNMDVPDPVTANTLASATVGSRDEDMFFPSNHLSDFVLTPGLNTIAVEIHQSSAGSSDISFAMKMFGNSVIPILGVKRPPAFINFEETPEGEFEHCPSFDPFFKEIGWNGRVTGFNTYVHFLHPGTGEPTVSITPGQGFMDGHCFAVTSGSALIRTRVGDISGSCEEGIDTAHLVNLSNYENVQVQFGLRSWDAGTGMQSNERAKFTVFTSVDGSSFDEEVLLEMTGGALDTVTETLVSESDMKRVKVPTGPIASWNQPSFNDASWLQSTRGAGYERSGSNTYDPFFGPGFELEGQLYNRNPTLYMRIPFNVDDPGAFTGLQLCMRYDDGFVAYLNGHEVARRNAPGGTPNWNSQASATHSDTEAVVYENVQINSSINRLVAGNNILAIQGLNRPSNSSDFLIEAELKGVLPSGGGGGGEPGPPTNLNAIARPITGSYTTFKYDIDDQVQTLAMQWDMAASRGDNAIFLDNVLVTGDPLTPDSYTSWIQLTTDFELDDLGAPDADPDGDGIPNAQEYAFGGSATVADEGLRPIMSFVEVNGNQYLAMTWRQLNLTTTGTLEGPTGAYRVRDIRYVPQFSTDGIDWDDGVLGSTEALQIGEFEGEEEDTVTITARTFDPISGNTPRLFGRIKIIIDDL